MKALRRLRAAIQRCLRAARRKPGYYALHWTNQISDLGALYSFYLGEKSDGYFVEFGAFDGETTSNSSALADLGWEGLFIEPVDYLYSQCVARHRRNSAVTVLNCGVSDVAQSGQISVAGPLSTLSASALESFEKLGWAKGLHTGDFREVTLRPLENILTDVGAPTEFDVLSVDVEGYEWEALQNFDFDKWKPKMVIVELHDSNAAYSLEWNNSIRVIKKLSSHGYRIVWKDLSNTVFVSPAIAIDSPDGAIQPRDGYSDGP